MKVRDIISSKGLKSERQDLIFPVEDYIDRTSPYKPTPRHFQKESLVRNSVRILHKKSPALIGLS